MRNCDGIVSFQFGGTVHVGLSLLVELIPPVTVVLAFGTRKFWVPRPVPEICAGTFSANETDLRNCRKYSFCAVTSESSPVILKNQLVTPRVNIATRIRARNFPSMSNESLAMSKSFAESSPTEMVSTAVALGRATC